LPWVPVDSSPCVDAGEPPKEQGRFNPCPERSWDPSHFASDAIGYATHYSRSHDAVIRLYDEAGIVMETHEHTGDFKEP
jgi:hypothetical protein